MVFTRPRLGCLTIPSGLIITAHIIAIIFSGTITAVCAVTAVIVRIAVAAIIAVAAVFVVTVATSGIPGVATGARPCR